MWVGSGGQNWDTLAWGPCQCRSWGAQLSWRSWGTPCSPILQQNQSIINCVSPALAPACSRVSAGQVGWGDFGEKEGLYPSGKLPCLGERSWREGPVPGPPGYGDSDVYPRTCHVTHAQGAVLCTQGPEQGWGPHPQPRKGWFWLCHEDHRGQHSRGSCATPRPGEPDSPPRAPGGG